jgi:hypothetical protein
VKGAAKNDNRTLQKNARAGGKALRAYPSKAVAMWMLITSDGRRVSNIGCEEDARRTAHAMGTTQLRGPFSWDVVDGQGCRFTVEIKHRTGWRS